MTIDRDQLEASPTEVLQRLAKFVEKSQSEDSQFKLDPNWDHKTLARRLFWEINPIPEARMY
jgi:hypothetical protein